VHRQHNTLAVFVEQQTMVVALMIVFGLTGTGVLFTALSALGVVQAPDDEPGRCLALTAPLSASAVRSDSPGLDRLSVPARCRASRLLQYDTSHGPQSWRT
jgi:hypothetical protein